MTASVVGRRVEPRLLWLTAGVAVAAALVALPAPERFLAAFVYIAAIVQGLTSLASP